MKITSLHTRPLVLAFREPYHWAGRVDYGAVNVLIEVGTDEGITGYGESTAARPADGVMAALHGIAPLLIGQSPFDIELLMHRCRFLGGFSHNPRFANLTLAGVEMALWDITGIAICLHGQSVTGMTDLAQHQVALTVPNLADGNQIMHQLLTEDVLAAPDITPTHGKLSAAIASRPGLGFELNWEAIEHAAARY